MRLPDRDASAFNEVSRTQSRIAHDAMPDHEAESVALLPLGQRQELRRKLAHRVAIECNNVCDPEAVEDRK